MRENVAHWIDGQIYQQAGAHVPLVNPASEEQLCCVPIADEPCLRAALAASEAAYPTWADTPPVMRARLLQRFKEILQTHSEALAAVVTREHGKVLADSRAEIARAVELLETTTAIAQQLRGDFSDSVSHGVDCVTFRQPLGVCVGVSPFNFPVMVPVWLFAQAIACGNTFILKPSEQDPSAAVLLAEYAGRAGLPRGVLNVIHGDHTTVAALLRQPAVQAVAAVASTAVAKTIYQTAIAEQKRAQTFGGAKNHALVMPDADLAASAKAIVGAAYGSAGERCMALPVVVAVGDQVAETLRSHIMEHATQLQLGDGMDSASHIGPLISKAHLERVQAWIAAGVAEGAELCYDGRQHPRPRQGYYLGPTLFDRVSARMRIYQEEIFGPVLCLVRVDDFAEGLSLINGHRYGNGAAIFTRDGGVGRRFMRQVQAGMVGVNIPIPVPISFHSFGGWKDSSFGDIALHGRESVHFYTRPKSVTVKWPEETGRADTDFIMPIHD